MITRGEAYEENAAAFKRGASVIGVVGYDIKCQFNLYNYHVSAKSA